MAQGTRSQRFDCGMLNAECGIIRKYSTFRNPHSAITWTLETLNPVFHPVTQHYFEVCCENALGTLANQIYTGQEI
jgi:hypothetical protein